MSFQQWAQIVGAAVVGGLIATLAQFGLEMWRVRRERRWRHFDELTDFYPQVFHVIEDARDVGHALRVKPTALETSDAVDDLYQRLRAMIPRGGVGLPRRTRAALEALYSGLWLLEGISDYSDLLEDGRTLPFVHRSAALLELHARWDLGHADAPPQVLVENSPIRFLPRRLQSAVVRRRSLRSWT